MSSAWIKVCKKQDLVKNSGVCALVEGRQIAIFSLHEHSTQRLVATSNWDPIGKANVMYRGLLGSVEQQIFIASPLYKQRYDLDSGECLDDDSARLVVHGAKLEGEDVFVSMVG